MSPDRTDLKTLTTALLGAVFAIDLLWWLLEGSSAPLAYGLVDEPAHLATCAIALFAVAAVRGSSLPARFVAAALLASVAIDIDHIPAYLGWDGLTGALPRPYTHGLLLVTALIALASASRGRLGRQVSLGLAFGVSAHLLRDLATGPGVPLLWPLSSGIVAIPYALFAIALSLAALAATLPMPRSIPAGWRIGLGTALAVLVGVGAAIAPASADAARTVSVGVHISGADENPGLIDEFNSEVGRDATFVVCYKDWGQAPFVGNQLDGIWNHGAVPLITWEPAGIPLAGIARGQYDGYVSEAARVAAAWDQPLMVRFGQEMNGDWFSWGGRPHAFKAAWRHLVKVFDRLGADKVRWVWNPYVNSRGGRLPFEPYFPGSRWVDWVGLDAINWGSPFPWRTFRQIIGGSYRQLIELSSKPVVIGEAGSGELGGSKAHWLSRMLRRNVPRMRQVRAVAFWSENDPRGDLRVQSSASALGALRNGLAQPLYGASRLDLINTPAALGR